MKLYNEDCLNILKTIPSNSVDLVVTDCPYHIASGGCTTGIYGNDKQCGEILKKDNYIKTHSGYMREGSKHISLFGMLNDSDATTYTKQGKLFKFNDIEFRDWLPDVYRVLKEDTHCYIMINARNLKDLQVECEKVGFIFQQLLVWVKNNATPNKYYLNNAEFILMLRKGKAKNINNMGTKNVLHYDNIRNKQHPTEKNVEMLKVLISNSSSIGGVVLDPFMGSGTTGVACKKLGRDFIGIEIDEKYFNIAKERIGGEPTIDQDEPKQDPEKFGQLTLDDFM